MNAEMARRWRKGPLIVKMVTLVPENLRGKMGLISYTKTGISQGGGYTQEIRMFFLGKRIQVFG